MKKNINDKSIRYLVIVNNVGQNTIKDCHNWIDL
jgi:hypothetical protein